LMDHRRWRAHVRVFGNSHFYRSRPYIPHPKITIFDYFLFFLNQAVGTV
jgi:hypothetical protein